MSMLFDCFSKMVLSYTERGGYLTVEPNPATVTLDMNLTFLKSTSRARHHGLSREASRGNMTVSWMSTRPKNACKNRFNPTVRLSQRNTLDCSSIWMIKHLLPNPPHGGIPISCAATNDCQPGASGLIGHGRAAIAERSSVNECSS